MTIKLNTVVHNVILFSNYFSLFAIAVSESKKYLLLLIFS